MVAKKASSKAGQPAGEIKVTDDGRLAVNDAAAPDRSKANDGGPGPASSLETGVGSTTGASAGSASNFEGNHSRSAANDSKAMAYDVQCHTDEDGLFVLRFNAKSGDEAAQKALKTEGYKGMSVRGVTPASDPDPNSLGGERDASIMIANAENQAGGVDPLGTEANRKAVEELGKADIEELGE